MSSNYLVQATLAHDSALPEDVTVNTWNITTTATGDTGALDDAVDALGDFYSAVDAYLSSRLSGAMTFKTYDREDAQPRVPVSVTPRTLTVASTALPGEVALKITFQATPQSGLAQARRRGGIFLGPLSAGLLDGATGLVETGPLAAIQSAADALVTASNAATDWSLSIWSTVNNSAAIVTNGWIDNAWDTQRRRGNRPTARYLFS